MSTSNKDILQIRRLLGGQFARLMDASAPPSLVNKNKYNVTVVNCKNASAIFKYG